MHIAKVQAAIQEDIPLEGEEGMENPVNTSSSSSPSPSTDKRVVSLAAPSASDTTESSGASVNIDERSLFEGMCFAPDFVYKHYVVSLPGSGGKGDATRSSQRQLAHHLLNSIVGANSGTKGLSTIRKIQEAAVEGQLFGPTDPRRSDDFIAIWTSLLEKYVTPTVMQWTQGEKNEKRLLEIVDLCIAHAASTTPRASEGTAEAEGTVTPPSPRSPKSVCLSMPSSPSSSSTWSMTAQDVLIAHLTAVASNQNTWRNLGSPDLGSLGSGANGVEYKYWSLVLHDTLLQLVMAHALPSSSSVGKFEWIQTDAERQTEDAFDEFARLLVASSNLSEEALLFHQVSRRGCAFVKKVFGSGSGVDYGCIGTYVPRAWISAWRQQADNSSERQENDNNNNAAKDKKAVVATPRDVSVFMQGLSFWQSVVTNWPTADKGGSTTLTSSRRLSTSFALSPCSPIKEMLGSHLTASPPAPSFRSKAKKILTIIADVLDPRPSRQQSTASAVLELLADILEDISDEDIAKEQTKFERGSRPKHEVQMQKDAELLRATNPSRRRRSTGFAAPLLSSREIFDRQKLVPAFALDKVYHSPEHAAAAALGRAHLDGQEDCVDGIGVGISGMMSAAIVAAHEYDIEKHLGIDNVDTFELLRVSLLDFREFLRAEKTRADAAAVALQEERAVSPSSSMGGGTESTMSSRDAAPATNAVKVDSEAGDAEAGWIITGETEGRILDEWQKLIQRCFKEAPENSGADLIESVRRGLQIGGENDLGPSDSHWMSSAQLLSCFVIATGRNCMYCPLSGADDEAWKEYRKRVVHDTFLFMALVPTAGITGSGNGRDWLSTVARMVSNGTVGALPVKYHTVCHDAAGYLYTAFRLGPGYTYVGDSAYVPRSSWESFKNWFATRVSRVNNFSDSPYAGQLRGITFWQAVLADSPPAAAASS